MQHRFFYFFSVLSFLFGTLQLRAQMTLSISPLSCYVPNTPNTASAFVVSQPTNAASYTWSATGPCTPSFTPSSGNFSSATIHYGCCGIYTITCTALTSASVFITNSSYTTLVSCQPTITTMGNHFICAGSSATIIASGAQSYTWNTGGTTSAIVVTPSVNTVYWVTGANSSGCMDTTNFSVAIVAPASPGFTYTQGPPPGQVNFINQTTPLSGSTYTWYFGNGYVSTATYPSLTYTSNGTYTVNLVATTGCGGTVSIVHTITVSTLGPSCAASFTTHAGAAGSQTFVSTSTGTNSSTIFSWNFGNGSPTYSASGSAGANPPPQSYPAPGNYTVTLSISNASLFCSSSASLVVSPCFLAAHFYAVQTGSASFNFINVSTNTLSTSSYSWNFGDGSSSLSMNPSHTYTNTGTDSVTLFVSNASGCTSHVTHYVTVISCSLHANFSHTVFANGAVGFNSVPQNTALGTTYYWDFGDGIFSAAANPTHTYVNAGTYSVTFTLHDSLSPYCHDTTIQSINVTGISCLANSNFTLTPAGTPQYWNAIPAYPWNVIAATWYWGDGTQSNSLYASHLYSVAATYSICLSVTVSCGSSSSYCFPYYVSRTNGTGAQVISINVIPPGKSDGIAELNKEPQLAYALYPNPNPGSFNVLVEGADKPIQISVHTLMGECIYTSELQAAEASKGTRIYLENAAKGVYFVTLRSGEKTSIQKMIVGE